MSQINYRLSETPDPEERLEDAALWKALYDEYQGNIRLLKQEDLIPEKGVFFGRFRKNEKNDLADHFPYWEDPGFKAGIRRRVTLCDLNQAKHVVQAIHAQGKDAFIKATRTKFMTLTVPRGQNLMQALGDMAYSFIDRSDCLLVQDHLPMRCERRFVVMGGSIVTHSPVATHLTPLSRNMHRDIEYMHFQSPHDRTGVLSPQLTHDMVRFVEDLLRKTDLEHVVIDVASVAETPEVIEFNPCHPGQFGLFACDPVAIARGTRAMLPDDLAASLQDDMSPYRNHDDQPFDDAALI